MLLKNIYLYLHKLHICQFAGWKNIFTTYGLAAWDHDEAIVNLSFQSTTEIVKDLFANNNQALIEAFQVTNSIQLKFIYSEKATKSSPYF